MIAFRRECRAYAERWLDTQREEFKRLGVTGDWTHPYATMSFDAEAQIAREIMNFAENGLLYRGSKPVMWSVVEKTALAAVIPCVMGWADIGSWSELHKLGPRDDSDNLVRGDARVIDGERNLVWSDGAPVVVVGLNDIAVVSTPEGVIVLPLSRSQDVKLAVVAVKASRPPDAN